MFKDVNISKDIMNEFKNSNLNVDMSVNVLSRGVWPEWPVIDMILPSYFINHQNIFEKFYKEKYNGRKLTWHNSKANCVLNSYYESGNKIFCTSLLQTLVLLLFNSANKLTLKEIRERTGIGKFLN